MGFGQIIAIALLLSGFAPPAGAGEQMFTGEMIVHMRGSDATKTDTAGNFIGIPFGLHCNTRSSHIPASPPNPHLAHKWATFYTSGSMMNPYTVTIPKFGGQIAIDTDMDMIPDLVPGCATASRQAGLPLTGTGLVATTGIQATVRTKANPREFSMPSSGLSRVTSGASFLSTTWVPLYQGTFPFNFEIEDADLKNAAGGFAKSDGPGSFTVSRSLSSTAQVRVKAGANQFGGTMRLLGHYSTNRGIESGAAGFSTSTGETPWNLQYIGAGAKTSMSVVTGGKTYATTISRKYYYPIPPPGKYGQSARKAAISVFSWTTGTAEVTALSGPQATVLKRAGYDNRTPRGAGPIQLVSPALTRWTNTFGDYHTGSIAVMKLVFVPEPVSGLMLASGIFTIGLLYRTRRAR
jgi:hypothetical protein